MNKVVFSIVYFLLPRSYKNYFKQKYSYLYNKDIIFDKKFKQLTVNKDILENKINNFNTLGITTSTREQKLIVSLTSFPQRIKEIKYTLYSLLNQTLKPDKIILWLADSQFPNKEKDLPKEILNFKNNGLSIEWCDDLKSYKKLIPALLKYPQAVIITADDDVYYRENWLELLYNSYLKNPNMVHCHRAHQVAIEKQGTENIINTNYKKWKKKIKIAEPSLLNFITGVGGVLYPPHSLYKDVSNIDLFKKLSPYADDIWFWAMAVLNNTKINIVKNNQIKLIYINPERETKNNDDFTLSKINNAERKNEEQLENVLSYYKDKIKFVVK